MTCIRTGVSTIHPRKDTHATGAFDIHVLLPLSTNPPSTSSATVSIPAGSEPWFGSVKPCNAHGHCQPGAADRVAEMGLRNSPRARPLL